MTDDPRLPGRREALKCMAWAGTGALYALSALGGSVLVYLISPLSTATAGASGAIFGLFGATFVVARRLNLDVRWVVALIVINATYGPSRWSLDAAIERKFPKWRMLAELGPARIAQTAG